MPTLLTTDEITATRAVIDPEQAMPVSEKAMLRPRQPTLQGGRPMLHAGGLSCMDTG